MKNQAHDTPDRGIETFAKRHRLTAVRDPDDGTTIVPGRAGRSHLFDYGQGLLGVAVMPKPGTAHRWNAARKAFRRAGMEIRQNGDHEGIATFDPANGEQVRLALKYADVKRKRTVSAETCERLKRVGFKKPVQAVVPVPQSARNNTVEGEKTL